MEPFSKIMEDSNKAGVGFLVAEVNAGLTFLDVASTTMDQGTASRNRDKAHLAYETILRYSDRVRVLGPEKNDFEEKVSALKARLIQAGVPDLARNP